MDLDIDIQTIGGNCPVQAEGTVNGVAFYFRARGEHWSMSIGGVDVIGAPEWFYEEEYPGGAYKAGWMEQSEAVAFIEQAAKMWVEKKGGDQ